MNAKNELLAYLECEKEMLNAEFPQNAEITANLFQKVYDFFNVDFTELTDNRVYRCFLQSFKEIIGFAFEKDVSKKYLRYCFKSLNKEIVVGFLVKQAKSREKDIRFAMTWFYDSFVATWQWCDNNKKRVLAEIMSWINSQM